MSSRRRAERDAADVGRGSIIRIASGADIVAARKCGREFGAALGFTGSDLTLIVTAISELAHNIIEYAVSGHILLDRARNEGRLGVVIVARDEGPGIPDIAAALCAGVTDQRVSLGLPGVRSLMDDFEISSKPRHGTVVTVRKWLP
jgi:serine/threonine-protein kinase RsbT